MPTRQEDPRPLLNKTTPSKLSSEIDTLRSLSLPELRKRFTAVMGRPTNSADRDVLIEKIAQRIAFGSTAKVLSAEVQHDLSQAPTVAPDAPRKRAGRPIKGAGARIEKPAAMTATRKEKARRDGPSPFTADPRLPSPGSTISVTHKGVEYHSKFLGADGFEYAGQRYRSLSAIASTILGGVAVNGFLWWGLIKRPGAPATESRGKAPARAASKRRAARRRARKTKAKR